MFYIVLYCLLFQEQSGTFINSIKTFTEKEIQLSPSTINKKHFFEFANCAGLMNSTAIFRKEATKIKNETKKEMKTKNGTHNETKTKIETKNKFSEKCECGLCFEQDSFGGIEFSSVEFDEEIRSECSSGIDGLLKVKHEDSRSKSKTNDKKVTDMSYNVYGRKLFINGTGPMENYTSPEEVPWHSHSNTIEILIIENGITPIGKYAFSKLKLKSATIPDSVTSIGNSAFFSCTSLMSINIPNNMTSIGYYAFYSCSSLATINIPDRVMWIGYYAFYSSTSLTSINISNSITLIIPYFIFAVH